MNHQGVSDREIAKRLKLTPAALSDEWKALTDASVGVTREEAVGLIIAQLVLEARAALQHRKDELALILCAPEDQAVITFNVMGIITGISRYCEALLGLSADELVGMPIDVVLSGRAREVAESAREMSAAEEGAHVRAQRKHKRPDGSSFMAEHSLVALVGNGGHVTGFVRQITDLTRRRVHQVKIDELDATIALLVHE